MYHYAYLLTFPNGKQYIGAHSTNIEPKLDITYLGSGKALPLDRKDTKNVDKVILAIFTTRKELMDYEYNFIIANDCIKSDKWLNIKTRTFDRHGMEPWNKGKKTGNNSHGATYSRRYRNSPTPAIIAGRVKSSKKLTGTRCSAKGHPGISNIGFVPWYYITPNGEYVEVHDRTKAEVAPELGLTKRQIGHGFHYSNMHKVAKVLPRKGYVFGNLPCITVTVSD